MKAQGNSDIMAVVKDSFEKRENLKKQIAERMATTVRERKMIFEKKLSEFLGLK